MTLLRDDIASRFEINNMKKHANKMKKKTPLGVVDLLSEEDL